MGKRSNFERIERDFYRTPREAVLPLLLHLQPKTRFCEPCAGDGALIEHLVDHGHVCLAAWDIAPRHPKVVASDALKTTTQNLDCFITNPPWRRDILHPLILHLSAQAPTWLLFDADWKHTKQSAAFMPMCRRIVSVGRVKWFPETKMTGKDNCCWYLFDADRQPISAEFFGRAA